MVDIFGKRRKEQAAVAASGAAAADLVDAPAMDDTVPAGSAPAVAAPSAAPATLRRPTLPVPAKKLPILPTAPMRNDPTRRLPASAAPRMPNAPGAGRQLVVGREISLSGEIKDCERLVVEGAVSASLIGCEALEVTDGGSFRGPADVQEAVISGVYEGELTVHGRLTVTASGRVSGRIVYREIEIQAGAQVTGTLDLLVVPVR